ncbi:MAG: TonB-dependent receptor [Akkermansia sp.]|nr:TonB-dependent receptor [Akkermansia sp.]
MIHNIPAPCRGAFRTVGPVLLLAGACPVARATDAVSAELPAITVSAHAAGEIAHDTTGVSVTVLDVAELRQEGIYSAAEAMTTVPGVYTLNGGGENQRGNICNVVIRGLSSGDSYMPMMDGMRLSGISGSGIQSSNVMARTNLFDVGTLEVLRGAQGATHGGSSMAGVIYMETPKGSSDKPSLSLFSEGGSHDSYTGNVTAQGERENFAWFLSSTYEHSNNDLSLANGDKVRGKHAGRYENMSQALRLDYRAKENTTLTATYRREDASYHYANRYGVTPYTFRTNLVTAKAQTQLSRALSSSLMAGYYGSDAMLGHGWYSDLRNVQVEWSNTYAWNKQHTTVGGFSWVRSQYGVDSVFETSARNTDRNLDNTYGLFAEHHFSPNKGWDNTLAARLDQSSHFDALTNLRASTSYRFNREQTRLFGSVGQSYRAPGSFQYSNSTYFSGGSTYCGNPLLDCSTALAFDAGVEHDLDSRHTLKLTFFHTRIDDAIETVPTGEGHYTYHNASGHRTAMGVEITLEGTWTEYANTGYSLSCTLTEPKESDGRQIPASARQTWKADFHTEPMQGLTTGIGLSAATGRSNFAGYPTTKLDSFYTLRWYAQYEVNEHLTLHARVENITNQKYVIESDWQDQQYSFISAGISFHGGCTLKF